MWENEMACPGIAFTIQYGTDEQWHKWRSQWCNDGVWLHCWLLQGLFGSILNLHSVLIPHHTYISSPHDNISIGAMKLHFCEMLDVISLLFASLLFATHCQGEEWDQRFNTVRQDLNKWSSSKTIFPHLSPARGFICLVICSRVNRVIWATDEGNHKEWHRGV